jgi:hypothetical protein
LPRSWLRDRFESVDSYLLGNVFAFGESFEALSKISAGMNVRGDGGAIDVLDSVAMNWYGIRLSIGTDDFDDIESTCKYWKKGLLKRYRKRNKLTQDDADGIRGAFSGYRERYLMRLYSSTVIPEVQLKVLNPHTLEEGPQEFFEPDTWKSLSREIKEDLSSAVICLLVGEWTPAVMIALRAAEEAARKYYEFKTKTPLEKFKSWKWLVEELKRHNVTQSLLGHLDFVREKRNDAEHPGKRFLRDEAETTFMQVIGTLVDVYQEMKNTSKR